ncbi:ABC transporter ATP-binding protein [Azospirillum brasilense]|uniref:ABC transporter ATP-binding protein n=2 Tax=Azospirillum brasilense TaxID=192 RepID=A0A4D8R4A9_AZOBR|nr:ABC transporter ATP-binding protein [Azospirillum brasilense]QEL93416.1 ABC transporter ATP-binding protein [Azospirillum brasilense]QEL99740.1 ABC transporter ATP-binding protein [Azospirillum brasilense]QEM00743.1 ABC transporter ATP-binding protein [Azospirillum brasilense]
MDCAPCWTPATREDTDPMTALVPLSAAASPDPTPASATAMSALLEVRNLTINYASPRGTLRAASDVSFAIRPGEVMGLVGESGSGKSTVAMAILDLLGEAGRIDGGEILFEGTDLRRLSAGQRRSLRGDRIAAVFQDPFTSLNPALTVGRQIAEPLVQHKGLTPRQAAPRVEELLAEVGIREPRRIAQSYPHQLSGGMQQRVLIATALGCDPKLLILDEPTTALDVTVEARIIELLAGLCESHHLSALFVSHNLGIVNRICNSVCVLYGSEVVETGRTREVLARPVHPYTKGLVAALPRITTDRRHRLSSIPGTVSKLSGASESCVFAPRCPFAEETCRRLPQALRVDAAGNSVRCWKAEALAGTPWPEESTASRQPATPPARTAPLVQVEALRKVFGERRSILPWLRREGTVAVDDVSFTIQRGEVLGVVGESGSGKSTIGRSLLALIEPTAGTVLFDGADFVKQAKEGDRDLRRRAQLVFQNSAASLNPRKTVGAAMERPLVLAGRQGEAERREMIAALLTRVGLPAAYADRYPHELSGGERQRVNIARALATDPEFVVCDEAVSALDVSVQANILNLLADLRDELGLSYLFITHDIAVVSHIADRVLVVYGGTICEEGPIGRVLRPPYHPYTEALLSAVPRLSGAEDGPEPERILLEDSTAPPGGGGCAFRGRCPRKLGTICDERAPPVQTATDGHRIACHIPLAELAERASVFPELAALH